MLQTISTLNASEFHRVSDLVLERCWIDALNFIPQQSNRLVDRISTQALDNTRLWHHRSGCVRPAAASRRCFLHPTTTTISTYDLNPRGAEILFAHVHLTAITILSTNTIGLSPDVPKLNAFVAAAGVSVLILSVLMELFTKKSSLLKPRVSSAANDSG